MKYLYNENSPEIQYLADKDVKLKQLISCIGPLEYSTDENSYEFLVSTIIGQMLSNKVADVIFSRLYNLCGGKIEPEVIAEISKESFRAIGISSSKTETIFNLTNKFRSDRNLPQTLSSLPDKVVIDTLTEIRGIGNWTAKMYLIFVLNRMDVIPYEDGAFIQAFEKIYGITETKRNKPLTQAYCARWSPYASIAARYLYLALDGGYLKDSVNADGY